MRGKRYRWFLDFPADRWKSGRAAALILLSERHLSESVRCGPAKFAVAVVVEHFLEICAGTRRAD